MTENPAITNLLLTMSTPSYYEVNVAMKEPKLGWDGKPSYRHLFATHERSLTNEADAKFLFETFKQKFPAPEFNVTVSAKFEYGQGVDWA